MLTGTRGKDKESPEGETYVAEVDKDGKARLIGAVEGGWEQGSLLGTGAGKGDKVGPIGGVEEECVGGVMLLGKAGAWE